MADLLKDMYGPLFFERIIPVLNERIPDFNDRQFLHCVFDESWVNLELKQRVTRIATALHHQLPQSFESAASIIVSIAQTFRARAVKEQGFEMMFLPEYVALYGLDFPETSLSALHEITQLVSAEFAIRSFLLKYPQQTISAMKHWARDPNASVRRLSSEGCRPRLPWAKGVPWLKLKPELVVDILRLLMQDPSPYVRRSVANNLNDIAKDHPKLVLDLAKALKGTNPLTDEILRHGCRTLFRKGDPTSLLIHGINPKSRSKLLTFSLTRKSIKRGGELMFDFELRNAERTPTLFRIDYAIDYITGTGRTSTKVFRICERLLSKGQTLTISRKKSFQDYTTRIHYAGKHQIHLVVNGQRKHSAEFMVR